MVQQSFDYEMDTDYIMNKSLPLLSTILIKYILLSTSIEYTWPNSNSKYSQFMSPII